MLHKIRKEKCVAFLRSSVVLQNDHLGGILSQLRNESDSLENYLNMFTVTASSTSTYGGTPERIFNQDESNLWCTTDIYQQEHWVQIELKRLQGTSLCHMMHVVAIQRVGVCKEETMNQKNGN